MQRWHLTLGLGGVAVVAAFLVPRLMGEHSPISGLPTPPPVPPGPPTDLAVSVPPVPTPPSPSDSGHLILDAGLDHTTVVRGQDEERFVAITVQAPSNLGQSFRRSVDLGVVMDISGSMSGAGKIDYAKAAAKTLASGMEPSDEYGLVVFSDDATTILPAASVTDLAYVNHTIDRIYEGGGTNIYAGLSRGADDVSRGLNGENVGRIVLISDGKPTTGIQDPDAITKFVAEIQGRGITVSAIGLGTDFNEDLMAKIADMGGGTYNFVDDPRQLQTVFTDELQRSAAVVARGTHVDISLPEGVDPIEVLGWTSTPTAHGWSVDVGDVDAGQTKKIVVRVRVHGANAESMPIAGVVASYTDVVDQAPGRAHSDVSAFVTTEVATAHRSANKPYAAAATKAWGNSYLDKASQAYASGNIAEAQEYARQGGTVLENGSVEFDDAELKGDADNLNTRFQAMQAAPAQSEAGKTAVKQAKEDAYNAYR